MKDLITIAFVCITTLSSYSDIKLKEHTIPLAEHGTLTLSAPETWELKLYHPSESDPPMISFFPEKNTDFRPSIIPIYKPIVRDHNFVKALVEIGAKHEPQRTEGSEVSLTKIEGVDGVGYYYYVQQKSSNQSKEKFEINGSMGVGDILLRISILTDSKESDNIESIIKLLKTAKHNKD